MNKSNQAHVRIGLECVVQLLRADLLTPTVFDHHRHTAATLDIFDHAAAEHAVTAYDHLVPWRNQVYETIFHAHRSGARYRKRERVLGLEDISQQRFEIFHHVDEDRIQIPYCRQAYCSHDARVDFRGARTQQRALRRME